MILERLASLYPGVQTVAEEAVAADGAPAEAADWFWLIDPLDGTRGFIEGRESYTVNIALVHKGEVVAGAIHGSSARCLSIEAVRFFTSSSAFAFASGAKWRLT